MLPTRPLGVSGIEITSVGLGTWAMGGGAWRNGYGEQDDAESIATIRRAAELGVNWLDTAPVYGLGHAEEVVGRALSGLAESDRPMIFTKCGVALSEGDAAMVGRREDVRRDCEGSLARLGVDRIDLLQIHWPPQDGTPIEETWGAILELVAEGKVRAGGVSNFSVDLLERCQDVGAVASIQQRFSMLDRAPAEDLVPWCAHHDVSLLAYSPLASGLLTGRFTEQRAAELQADDWRSRSKQFTTPRLERNLLAQDALRPIAARHGTTPAAVALAWTTAWHGVDGAVAGARSPAQIDDWIDAATLELTGEDLDELAGALDVVGAGRGPERPVTR